MNRLEYEYRGLMAQTWDIPYRDTWRSADRFFYLDVIEQYGQPVLDVGCGTGRLLLDYLAQGIDIDGVDNSPEMLALCREKAAALGLSPNLYGQFMDTMALPRTYRTILIPPGFLQLIREREAADQALAHCYAYLQSGGVLVASFMTLGREGDPLEATWGRSAEGEDGAIVRRVACSHDDPAAAYDHTHDLYPIIVEGKVVAQEQPPATRFYTQAEAHTLLIRAGFEDVRLYGGFTFEAAKPDDSLFTVLGHKTMH